VFICLLQDNGVLLVQLQHSHTILDSMYLVRDSSKHEPGTHTLKSLKNVALKLFVEFLQIHILLTTALILAIARRLLLAICILFAMIAMLS
jgi:hypothetical protein